jgi:hypothetical protein
MSLLNLKETLLALQEKASYYADASAIHQQASRLELAIESLKKAIACYCQTQRQQMIPQKDLDLLKKHGFTMLSNGPVNVEEQKALAEVIFPEQCAFNALNKDTALYGLNALEHLMQTDRSATSLALSHINTAWFDLLDELLPTFPHLTTLMLSHMDAVPSCLPMLKNLTTLKLLKINDVFLPEMCPNFKTLFVDGNIIFLKHS